MKINSCEFQNMDKVFRLNLINSLTGYKSANLIATLSKTGLENLAIFSSVIHLGSSPALLGFVLRPSIIVPRDTYNNIMDTKYFTINHVTKEIIANAHHTSANYASDISEFEQANLDIMYYDDIKFPFLKNAPIQILCKYINEYDILENKTKLIVAAIETIFFDDKLISKDGFLQLDLVNTVAINGLDAYCLPTLIDRFEYARPFINTKSKISKNE